MKNFSDFYVDYYHSPIGNIKILSDDGFITGIFFSEPVAVADRNPHDLTIKCAGQLEEYFTGKRKSFNLPLKINGTEFQNKIWDSLQKIPYGATQSYQSIANQVNNPLGARAVGNSCNRNPFHIVIPCHRVVAANGNLTGYAGGLDKKEWLIEFEKINKS